MYKRKGKSQKKRKKLSTKKLNREKQTVTFIDLVLHSRAKHRKLYWLQPLSVCACTKATWIQLTHTRKRMDFYTILFPPQKQKQTQIKVLFPAIFSFISHYFFFSRKTRTCRQSMVACKTVIFVESARAEAIGIAPRHACVCRTKSKKTK